MNKIRKTNEEFECIKLDVLLDFSRKEEDFKCLIGYKDLLRNLKDKAHTLNNTLKVCQNIHLNLKSVFFTDFKNGYPKKNIPISLKCTKSQAKLILNKRR